MKIETGDLRLWRTEWGSKMVLVMVVGIPVAIGDWFHVIVVATGERRTLQVSATREIEETDIFCPLQNPTNTLYYKHH